MDDYWLGFHLVVGPRGTRASCGMSNNAWSALDEVATKSTDVGKTLVDALSLHPLSAPSHPNKPHQGTP